MTILSASASSSTQIAISASATPAGMAYLQVQYGTTDDFNWRPAPMAAPPMTADGSVTFSGFNQQQIYFLRCRGLATDLSELEAWSNRTAVYTPHASDRDLSIPNIVVSPVLVVPPQPVIAWTADSEIAGHPALCLGVDDPTIAWWSAAASSTVAFEAAVPGAPIDTIAVLETTAAEDNQIVVKGDTTTAGLRGVSPAYRAGPFPFRASPDLPGRGGYHALVRLPAPQAYPLWRIEVTGSMPGGVFTASYAIFGTALTAKNYTQGKEEDVTDLGTFDRARNGTPIRALGHRMRKVSFDISVLTEAQMETQFSQLGRIVGLTSPALVIPNSKPGAYLHDRILFGTISAKKDVAASALTFTDSFTVDSLI